MLLGRSPVNESTINRALFEPLARSPIVSPNYDTNVRRSLQQSCDRIVSSPRYCKTFRQSYLFFSGCIYHIGSLPNYASNYKQLTSRRRKSIVTSLHSSHLRHDITIGVLRLS